MSVFDPDWKPEVSCVSLSSFFPNILLNLHIFQPGEPVDMFPTLVMVGTGVTIVPIALRWVGDVIV